MSDPVACGIYAAIVTPVEADGAIATERWARHARRLLETGCHGLAVFGTTGETQAFSVPERQAGLEALLAAGIPPEALTVGIGCCARSDTVALARHALEHGVTRHLMLPPFFYKGVDDEGLFRAFAEAIEAVADPRQALLLYHFPQVTAVPLTTGLIDRLVAAFPGTLRGIKDSSGDLAHTLTLVEHYRGLVVFAGNDAHLIAVLEAGGAGTISAAANIAGTHSRAAFDAFERRDGLAAGAAMEVVKAVRDALQAQPMIPALKHAVGQLAGDPDWARVRPPLVELEAARGGALLDRLAQAGPPTVRR